MHRLHNTLHVAIANEVPNFLAHFKYMYGSDEFVCYRSYDNRHEDQIIIWRSSSKYIRLVRTYYTGCNAEIQTVGFTSILLLCEFLKMLYQHFNQDEKLNNEKIKNKKDGTKNENY